MFQNLIHGLSQLGNFPSIGYLVAGALIGMIIGVVPGLGGVVILAVILAFIQHLSLTATLCLFLGTYCGQFFSASISSILLNMPAHPESFAVTFDGFPMARRGEAGRALGISAASTCIGGVLGCIALVGFIPIINYFPNLFHPPEYVALVTTALILVGTLGAENASKALLSAGIGLMIASIGPAATTGTYRYTFSATGLYGGVDLVALVLGVFAIPQMVLVFGTGSAIARQDMLGNEITASQAADLERGFGRQVIAGVIETFSYRVALLRSAAIGVITGIIPGVGAFAANFLSYGMAQQLSRHRRHEFGTGTPEGIIAPEGSSLSKEAGSMVPLLGLGIPGGVGGAMFLAALGVKGVRTGYGFTTQYPVMAYEVVWIIALAGIIGTVAGVLLAPWLAKVTRLPGPFLVPFILSLAVVSPFVSAVSFFSVMEVLVFAIVGLVLRRLRFSLASFAVGLVLGPTLENNIYLMHGVFPGFTFLRRPLADVLFAVAIAILIWRTIQFRKEAKAQREHEPERITAAFANAERTGVHVAVLLHPYALLSLVTTSILVAVSIPFTIYGAIEYDFATALMPCAAGGLTAVVAVFRLPIEVRNYLHYLKAKRMESSVVAAMVLPPVPAVEFATVAGGVADRLATEPGRLAAGNDLRMGQVATKGVLDTDPVADLSLDNLAGGAEPPAEPPDGSKIAERSWVRNGQYTREMVAMGWFALLVLAAYCLGFNVAVPLFCVGYGMFATKHVLHSLWGRVRFGVGSAVVMAFIAYELQNLLHVQFTPLIHL